MENFVNNRNTDRVLQIPELNEFCRYIRDHNISNFSVVQKLFEKLFNGKFLSKLVDFELKKITFENYYTPSKSTYNSLEVVDAETFKINLVNINTRDLLSRTVLTGFSHDKIVLSLSKNAVCYSLYHQPNPFPIEIFDKAKTIYPICKRAALQFGESIFVKRYTDVFSYEGTDNDDIITALILSSKYPPSFDWEYGMDTLEPVRIVGDQDDCRIEQTCKILGELGAQNSIPVLAVLTKHEKHNIRWAAVRNIILIDFNTGIEYLEKLINDPHPEIANAVKTALNSFSR